MSVHVRITTRLSQRRATLSTTTQAVNHPVPGNNSPRATTVRALHRAVSRRAGSLRGLRADRGRARAAVRSQTRWRAFGPRARQKVLSPRVVASQGKRGTACGATACARACSPVLGSRPPCWSGSAHVHGSGALARRNDANCAAATRARDNNQLLPSVLPVPVSFALLSCTLPARRVKAAESPPLSNRATGRARPASCRCPRDRRGNPRRTPVDGDTLPVSRARAGPGTALSYSREACPSAGNMHPQRHRIYRSTPPRSCTDSGNGVAARGAICSTTRAALGLGTQSGGSQKTCGVISSTRLSPSCAMTRSISV